MANDTATPPADKTRPASGVTQALKDKLTIPRSATPYFVASLLAAVAMGWYFFVFVPQKLEYFVGLRFRTLAVAAGQIKGKAESLGASLRSAPATRIVATADAPSRPGQSASDVVLVGGGAPVPPPGRQGGATAPAAPASRSERDAEKYLRLLVPDIRLYDGSSALRLPGLQLAVHRPADDRNESLRASVAWERVAAQGAAASAGEFDDLVLADANGAVVWQREKTTPRIGNLTELLYAEDDRGTLMSPSWAIRTVFPAVEARKGLPKTAALKAVRVGVSSTMMLVQAVSLESPFISESTHQTMYVAGFVSRNRLQQQAMRIPLAWLVVVWLPVAIVFLALPFIKLATMQAKERFSFVNLVLMAVGTIAAAGLAAVIPEGPRAVSATGDRVLREIATRVDDHLAQETGAVLALAAEVAKLTEPATGLKPCAVPLRVDRWKTEQLCDLWVPLARFLDGNSGPVPELDVAIFLNDRGEQVRKWSTKAQLTGEASHRVFEHFQNLTSGSLWTLREGRAIPFTIEPLRAPTTAELGVVFAMPLDPLRNATTVRNAAIGAADDARFLALNIRPHAVVDAVMPPGYGFAMVAPDGKVLFHSNDGLSLEENFFEEVSNAQGVREWMQTERGVTWSGDYHGIPHRLHMQPVDTLQGSRWKIIAFQDLSPVLASVVEHQSGTFRLSLISLVLLLAVTLALSRQYAKAHGRDLHDLVMAPRVLDPRRLWGLVGLVVLGIAAIGVTGLPAAYLWADILSLFFVLLPLAAVGVSVYARWHTADGDDGRYSWLASSELGLLVVLVGALPAYGFARVVHRVQDVQATERWLEVAHTQTVAHAARAQARATGPGYLQETRTRLANHGAFRGGADPAALHFYVPGSPVSAASDPDAQCEIAPESGQQIVRALLDWTLFSPDRRGDAEVRACAGSNRLQMTGDGISLAAMVWPPTRSGDAASQGESAVQWEHWALALAILACVIAAANWARRRLMTPNAVGTATLEDVLTTFFADGADERMIDGSAGIMLVGPPRTRKDRRVKDLVNGSARFTEKQDETDPDPIYRINLLDETVNAQFVKDTLARVSAHSQEKAMLDGWGRLWVLVSNLETQLITADRRSAVLELLEELLECSENEPRRVVVVTTSIDPIAHFQEIFTSEREGIYDDDIPEVELSRSSLLLSRFRRCYSPIKASAASDPWWTYKPEQWEAVLNWEAADYPPLVEVKDAIRKAVAAKNRTAVPRAELARTFRSQALACYDLLWESCTRCEKIVLVQLAQEGFITTQNCEVVWGLVNKGLIVERPRPAIFNNSFRSFLRRIEHDHVVEQWEREDGDGLWVVAGRLIASSLIAGGLFYLTTQDFSVDSLFPVVSGTGLFGAPVVRALLARVTMRGAALMSA